MKQHDTKFLRLFFTSVTIFFLVEIITSPQKVVPTYEIVINTLSPETKKWFIKAIENSLNNNMPFEGKYSLIRPDGSMRYIHTIGKVIRNRDKKPISMFGVVQNFKSFSEVQNEDGKAK